ncbi:exostosin family protein [Alteromonas sp. M12]|uniref:exostosin domain-containing protein n=1 Tax=Alteromonas sp. M12 TaxID=3135644 RepID=UPI00319E3DDC
MVNVFFPYYQCGDSDRQKEIDHCLFENINNKAISKLIVLIDDNSSLPFSDAKITIISLDSRPTYKKWIELTKELHLDGISVLCNSDIYFDHSINFLVKILDKPLSFVALSRWELIKGQTSLHPNPHWSQDVWALHCDNNLSKEMLQLLDFPMGVPRCDNKIVYLFGIYGWEVFNPCKQVKSYHVHETELRTYQKKLDDRILGGVAYPHPENKFDVPAELEFDVYVKSRKNIKGVKINGSLERWRKEYEESRNPTDNVKPNFQFALSSELTEAIKVGKSLLKRGANFEMLALHDSIFFKNGYKLNKPVKVLNSFKENDEDLTRLFAFGIIPPVLDSFVSIISLKAKDAEDINFWQYPCATEKQAYENHLSIPHGEHIDFSTNEINMYIPLPWATYIDRKAFPHTYLERVKYLIAQYRAIAQQAKLKLNVHSVCQHIHWIRILETAQKIGITNLHLSHKDSKSDAKQLGIGHSFKLHGWPLIAVNYVIQDRSEGMERKSAKDKKLLASFIGAHMPHYLDDSRIKLFEAAKNSGRSDVFVDLGKEWHFNKMVYEEQVLNKEIESHHIDEHNQKTFKYNSILSDSKFSLCPIGAGPNTLRFWESIAVGSIPVIFSDDLAAFSELSFGEELLNNVFLWNEEVDSDLFTTLNNLPADEVAKRSEALINLYSRISKWIAFNKAVVTQKGNELVKKSEGQAEPKELRVLYVGASVTAQKNGYRPELNRLLTSKGYSIKQKVLATGATGSIFGLCNLSTLKQMDSFDLAVYEYSTGDLNIGLTPLEVIENVVQESLEFLNSIADKVVLINNYRSDYEAGAGDFVRDKHRNGAKKSNVQVIDVYTYFEFIKKDYSDQEWKDIYRDNVHTGKKGSELVALRVLEELEIPEPKKGVPINTEILKSCFYYPYVKGGETGEYVYPSSEQHFKYLKLSEASEITMRIKGEFWGLVSIVGPTSGWVEVLANDTIIQKFCQLDTHCYYERVQPRQFMRTFDDFIDLTIRVVEEEIDFTIVKQSHKGHELPRQLKLASLMGRNIKIDNVKVTGGGE